MLLCWWLTLMMAGQTLNSTLHLRMSGRGLWRLLLVSNLTGKFLYGLLQLLYLFVHLSVLRIFDVLDHILFFLLQILYFLLVVFHHFFLLLLHFFHFFAELSYLYLHLFLHWINCRIRLFLSDGIITIRIFLQVYRGKLFKFSFPTGWSLRP